MKSEFKIRTYPKSELAKLYLPNSTNVHSALNTLNHWITKKEELKKDLSEIGYNKFSKMFKPNEVKLIIKHLGEP